MGLGSLLLGTVTVMKRSIRDMIAADGSNILTALDMGNSFQENIRVDERCVMSSAEAQARCESTVRGGRIPLRTCL
jgi:hypothetical protein